MKDDIRELINEHGFIYWSEFMVGRRGNPWFLLPTAKMSSCFEICGLSKQDKKSGRIDQFEVLFDEEYVKGWLKANQDIVSFITSTVGTKTVDLKQIFLDFEKDANIVTATKNPRHTLYIKFKEHCNDRNFD